MLTMESLFDGIGGFPLAAVRNGVVPVWASEIEAFPIEVTKLRFPDMVHVWDITKLSGAELPPVDIVCGGSPCQDLSVAGARAGLAGARSGLFMEQTRVVKEMRDADRLRCRTAHLVRPRFMVWENVPGAFSSADGEYWTLNTGASPKDAVESSLSQILQVTVPQRYYLSRTACMGILRRAEERGKDLPPQLEAALERQAGIAKNATSSLPSRIDSHNVAGFCAGAGPSAGTIGYQEERAPTLKASASGNMMPSILCLNDQGGQRMDLPLDHTGTLRADVKGHQLLVYENHGIDARYTGPHKVAPTMSARYGTGGNNVPLVSREPDTICITGNAIDRQPQNVGNGLGWQADISYTLTATDRLSGHPDK